MKSYRQARQKEKLSTATFDGNENCFSHLLPASAAIMSASDTRLHTTSHIPYRLDGKVALVTGSGRGIGAAMAIELGRCGAMVVVNYANSKTAAERVVAEIKSLGSDAIAIQANVAIVAETTRLMDESIRHFGRLDIVCSNAGVVSFGHLGDLTEVYLFEPHRRVERLQFTDSAHKGGVRPRLCPQHTWPVLRSP